MTLRCYCAFFVLLLWAGLPAQTPELIVPTGHTRSLLHLEASPSGGLLASSSIDETVKVWDAAAGRELYTFRPGAAARDLAFSPDEKYLAVAAFNRVHLLNTQNWNTVITFDGWNTNGVCFHPRKQELYYFSQRKNSTGEDPLQLYAVNIPDGKPRQLTTIPRAADKKVATLDLSPDGTMLLLSQGSTAHLIPIGSGSPKPTDGARRFTPTGDLFFITDSGNGSNFGVRSLTGTTRWSLSVGQVQAGNRDLVHTMHFDVKNERFYWSNQTGRVAKGNYRSGEASMYEVPATTDRVVAAGANGILYLADLKTFRINAFIPPHLLQPRPFGEAVLSPAQLAGSEQPAQLSWGRGKVQSLRFSGRQIITHGGADGSYANGRLRYATDGSLLTAASSTSDVFSYRTPDNHKQVKTFKSGFTNAIATAPDAKGDWLAVIARDGYLLMNTKTNKSSAKGKPGVGDASFGEDAALSPAGDLLLLKVARTTDGTTNTSSFARLVHLSSGESRWEQKGSWENPRFSADGKRIAAEIFEHLAVFSATDGGEISRHPLSQGRFPYQLEFNAALDWACYTHDNRAYVYALSNNQEYQLTVPGQNIPFERATFFHDDFVAFAGREGILRLFDLRTRQYVAALVRYADTDDWALVSPDGRFDATPGAMRRMYYRIGNQRVALEQLFDGYYTPGLAGEIFGRLPRGEVPAPINSLRPAPSVEITYQPADTRNLIVEDDGTNESFFQARTQDAEIVVKGIAPQDRISELRLYRNGKRLEDQERGLVVEDDDPAPTGNERRFRVRLLPGTNAFHAVALNSQRTESPAAYLTVDYAPATAPEDPRAAPASAPGDFSGPATVTLHLITIGIDHYANPSYNLNYATVDANALAQRLDAGTRALVGNVREHRIRDADATKTDILRQVRGVVDQADADDLLVFYFAGHGLVPDRSSGEFYLVPHDATDAAQVAQKGISATVLRKLSTAISAERQLYILDACQSGGALTALTAAGGNTQEEKAIATLARTTGTHWLTATDSEQLAAEFASLGHGAFTYVLLDGLAGKADQGSDGAVSVNELKQYLERELPLLTERYGGRAQFPSSFGFGRDFLLKQ